MPISHSSPKTAQLQGQRIAVLGLGKTGMAVAKFCAQHGAEVTVFDEKPEIELTVPLESFKGSSIKTELGGIKVNSLQSSELIILSPGVSPSLPAVVLAKNAGIPITGEVEFASQWIQAPIVGITGTNGKSTVTSLCGAIAAETERPFFCGGNLGTPLIEAVFTEAAGPLGIVVCELSSFQLETANTLHCRSAAILNLTPDHLDRYSSMSAYGDAKAKITLNQGSTDVLVLNADDPEVLDLIQRNFGQKRAFYFSIQTGARERKILGSQIHGFVEEGNLILRGMPSLSSSGSPIFIEETYPLSELQLVGRHNVSNALAAFLLMRCPGLATYQQVRQAAAKFLPLPHRMEKVAVIRGITYYDDSKGTNVDAVAQSLSGFPQPFALIAGGRDKGGSYIPLAKVLRENKNRGVVLIGEAAPLIEQALFEETKSLRALTMNEAVRKATDLCQEGDAVILSPACSSYDMFRDYVHRAQVFHDCVMALKGPGGSHE